MFVMPGKLFEADPSSVAKLNAIKQGLADDFLTGRIRDPEKLNEREFA